MNTSPDRTEQVTVGGPAPISERRALQLSGIVKSFGDFCALDGVDFELEKGEVHALLGENGAGKSTLMNVVAGLYTPDKGEVSVEGSPSAIKGPVDAARIGIGMVHQHYKLVMPFNAVENILLSHPTGRYEHSLQQMRSLIREKAEVVGFEIDLDRPVAGLSVAEQQRVEILKILVAGAHIIILDEPTAVLTDEEGERLLSAMRKLAQDGSSIVLVTHNLKEALSHSDQITVMRGGKHIGTVSPEKVSPADLTRMIVGQSIVERPHPAEHIGEVRLRVSGVGTAAEDGARALNNVDFEVRSGEIYGIAGVGGNGQDELVAVLMGLLPAVQGQIHLEGHGDITRSRTDERRRFGMACIPADRHRYALCGDLPISDNFAISSVLEGNYGSWSWVDRKAIVDATRTTLHEYDVQGVRREDQRAGLLSGGNAQKLVIAREFSGRPEAIIAHSPNRGLDVRASAAVHGYLRSARDAGAAVILISEDLDEIMLLSDRIGVMNSGSIAAEFATPADRHEIGGAKVGHD